MITYQLSNNLDGTVCCINKKEDGVILMSIPFDAGNRAYQEYLEWVADGGVPEPADTPEEAE